MFFVFLEEKDIKVVKNYIFDSLLIKVDYKKLIELTSSGLSVKFQTTGKQLKFQPNHIWVSCNFPNNLLCKRDQ